MQKEGIIYDPNKAPVYTTIDIIKRLPHRYPFLLVDKIVELTPQYVVGVKNVTFNEGLFQGHFPGNPIFPGVLQVEALAQTGGILALESVPDPHNYDTIFAKIEKVKFKKKIVPGDTMILKMEFTEPIKRGICMMNGQVWVGDSLCAEGFLIAQIIKTRNDAEAKV